MKISIQNSLILKGFAIVFMLWHHLFMSTGQFGEFVLYSAKMGKICVAMFIFMSGYGLAAQQYSFTTEFKKILAPRNMLFFYLSRLWKLYANFWFVFIVFVPIGIYGFDITLADRYGDTNILPKLVKDFFGFGYFKSYNITWWFYTLIIKLYLIFPILFVLLKKWLLPIFIIIVYATFFTHVKFFHSDMLWLFVFSLGIVWKLHEDTMARFISRFKLTWVQIFSLVFLIGMLFLRYQHKNIGYIGDGFVVLSFLFVLVMFQEKLRNSYVEKIFSFLGKHSMNIFMTHTFIYWYWFKEFIQWFANPIFMFVVLLVITIGLSICIEWVKEKLKFYSLVSNIDTHIKRLKKV